VPPLAPVVAPLKAVAIGVATILVVGTPIVAWMQQRHPVTASNSTSDAQTRPQQSDKDSGQETSNASDINQAAGSDTASTTSSVPQSDSQNSGSAVDANQLIDQAIQAQSNGDSSGVDNAITQLATLRNATIGDTAEASRINKLGLAQLKSKNYAEAAKYFESASETDPSRSLYFSNLGFALMNDGRLTESETALRQSLALDGSRSVAWGDLGLTFAKQGTKEKAVSCLLVGYHVSNGETLKFLQSLSTDEIPAFQEAGTAALAKVEAKYVQEAPGKGE
jgi:Flp pilus assembly protein TadD